MRVFGIIQIFALLFFGEILGIQFSDVTNSEGENFDLLYSESAAGLSFQVVGESLIVDGNKKERSTQNVTVSGRVKKAWLLWSGEVKKDRSNEEKIRFLTADGAAIDLTADKMWRKKSSGTLYGAAVDVTKYLKKSGPYGVQDLASDPLHFYSAEKMSVAGWALFVVEKKKGKQKKSIQILTVKELSWNLQA